MDERGGAGLGWSGVAGSVGVDGVGGSKGGGLGVSGCRVLGLRV